MRLGILFDMFFVPFEMKKNFANVSRTTASTNKFIH